MRSVSHASHAACMLNFFAKFQSFFSPGKYVGMRQDEAKGHFYELL